MRIGVISDTHIKSKQDVESLKETVTPYFKDVDLILHAGDLVCLDALEPLQKIAKTIAVSGNMDYPEVVNSLPKKTTVKIAKFEIGLIHSSGPPQGILKRIRREFTNPDCIVFGHTHQPLSKLQDNILFFNPGSPLDKIFTPTNSLGILEMNNKIKGEIILV